MSAYVPSASASDGLEYGQYVPCLPDPADTLTVMTTILQVLMGSCVKNSSIHNQGSYSQVRKQDQPQVQALNTNTINPTCVPQLSPLKNSGQNES